MPTYSMDKEDLDEIYEDDPVAKEQVKADFQHEGEDVLWTYEAASCALNPDKLSATSRLALRELRTLGATQIAVRYDGGGDEGFAHFENAKTPTGELNIAELAARFAPGPVGDVPEGGPIFGWRDQNAGRVEQAHDALSWLVSELAFQLLGEGFGTGEFSIEGRFVADLETNTLTDIEPEEN